jgi:gluconolactonase
MRSHPLVLCSVWLVGIAAGDMALSAASDTAEAEPSQDRALHIEHLTPGLDSVLSPDAQIEVLATGYRWTEGPLWVESEQALLFSDVPANTVYAWREGEGVSVYLQPSGYTGAVPRGGEPGANGLALGMDGQLILCQHGDRRLARMSGVLSEPVADYLTIADEYEGARFNSPNDLAVDSSGNIYFTDPPYGLEQGVDDAARELEVYGVYRVAPDRNVTLLIEELKRPNGVALSPDERTLYVSNSDPEQAIWMSYSIRPDGTLSDPELFYDATALVDSRPGLPDGMEVDASGNLFATGPGGVLIFTPAAELLGTIVTGVPTGNVAFNADKSVLYITADDSLLRVRLH